MLTFERANELFKYEPETGMLIRKVTTSNNRFHAGTTAGCSSPDGYLRVRADKVLYMVHRVCYLLAYGSLPDDMQVDHINHVRDDNRLVNLRFVTQGENLKNQSVSSKSTTGVTGVYFSKSRNKFIAQIKVNRQVHYLGCYNTLEAAAAARAEANLKFNFHNNHGKGRAEYVRKKSIT